MGVITEGAIIAGIGVIAGAVIGAVLTRVAGSYLFDLKNPSALPLIASALVLLGAAVVASLMPAARAARVDVMQALRTE
jgi:ABC-type antimicrobial peptide transport system permease subunit